MYDGVGLISFVSTGGGGEGGRGSDEGAAIHISGPNGETGQHGWEQPNTGHPKWPERRAVAR